MNPFQWRSLPFSSNRRNVTFLPTTSWNLIESFSERRSRSNWKGWEIASEPVNPLRSSTSVPRGVEIAIRRLVCVYAMCIPSFAGPTERPSIRVRKHRVSGVGPEFTGLQPAHPTQARRVETLVAEAAPGNLRRAQRHLHLENHRLASHESGQLPQLAQRLPVGQELAETVEPERADPNPEPGLLIPNLVAQKRSFAKLVPLELRRKVAPVRFLQRVPASYALFDFHRNREIVLQQTTQRARRTGALRDQACVEQESFIGNLHPAAQARGPHADQVEQVPGERVGPPVSHGRHLV